MGVKLTHGQSLEALAAAEGFGDWNRLAATLSSSHDVSVAPFSVLLSNPGDGTSVVYRFHALNLLDRFPQDHVLMVSPFPHPDGLHCQRWNDKEERLVFEGEKTAWPALETVRGKVLLVMPPASLESPADLSIWLQKVLSSWARWKGYGRTRAFFGIDIHRYSHGSGTIPGAFSELKGSMEVRLFTQTVDSLKEILSPGLEVVALTKLMSVHRRSELAQLEANVTLLTSNQGILMDDVLGTYEGLVRYIASPLLNPSSASRKVSTGPMSDRLHSFLEDEGIIWRRRAEARA